MKREYRSLLMMPVEFINEFRHQVRTKWNGFGTTGVPNELCFT